MPEKRRKIEKMNAVRESELSETASEGERECGETSRVNFVSRSIQSNFAIPREHRFSVTVFRDLARGGDSEKKYINDLTGFSSKGKFRRVLEFLVPRVCRKNIIYWYTKANKHQRVQ